MTPYPTEKIKAARAPKLANVAIDAVREVGPYRYGLTGGTALYANTWSSWNITLSGGSGTVTIGTDIPWNTWNVTATTASTAVTNIWTRWQGQPMTAANLAAIEREVRHGELLERAERRALGAPAVLTAEQRAANQARDREYFDAEKKRKEAVALARVRAKVLLLQCLSPEQREDVEKKACFYLECHSPNGTKRRYRIDTGYTHGNVKLVDDQNRVLGQYCVQPNGVPIEDACLAQKLWLETNEDEFKRKANFTPLRTVA